MVLEIPAGPKALSHGVWYCPEQGRETWRLEVVTPDEGDDTVKLIIPELLLDEHGHNTMVCHGKYVGINVKTEYSDPTKDIHLGSFRETRPLRRGSKTLPIPVNPVNTGGDYSCFLSITKSSADEVICAHGGTTEFRGRWKRYFSRSTWVRGLRDWVFKDAEHSEEWRDRKQDEVDPPAAPEDHVGPISATDRVPVSYIDIGYLKDYRPKTFLSPRHFMRFNELNVVSGKAAWDDHVKHAFLEAHLDAMSRFPKQADNDLANAIEVGGMIASVLLGDPDAALEFFGKQVVYRFVEPNAKTAAKTLGGFWMAYRYAYSTTKQDTQQRISYLAREVLYNNICPKCYGQADVQTHMPGDVQAVVKHSFRALPNEADLMSTIRRRLYEGGIMPSLYKGWDLVPFSFVVDWVGEIGNYLEGLEGIHHAREYLYTESCYSLQYFIDVDIEGVQQRLQMYTRVYELPPLDEQYWDFFAYNYTNSKGSSVTTKLKRSGDVGALTLNFI